MLTFRSAHDVAAFVRRRRRMHDRYTRSVSASGGVPLSFNEFIASGMSDFGGHFRDVDMDSRLFVQSDGVEMEALANGPSNAAVVLRSAEARLASGEGSYNQGIDDCNYGLHLRFRREGDDVVIERVREVRTRSNSLEYKVVPESEVPPGRPGPSLVGPASVVTSWGEFVCAIADYKRWHLTTHVLEAPWLRRVPLVQQWMTEEGMDRKVF